jgi:hypothetical protein
MPTISITPAVPWFAVMLSIGPFKVSAVVEGPKSLTISVRFLVTFFGSATNPTIDTMAINAGKIDKTE